MVSKKQETATFHTGLSGKHKTLIKRLYKKDVNSEFNKRKQLLYRLEDKNKLLGYAIVMKPKKKKARIDWIWAKPGHGTKLMQFIEKELGNRGVKSIGLNLSIDPMEKKSTVVRRINFYIKNQFRVVDITFREKHGALLRMKKELNTDGNGVIVHKMRVKNHKSCPIFDMIADGRKTVEGRTNIKRWENIRVGDQIEFQHANHKVRVVVTAKVLYPTLQEYLEKESVAATIPCVASIEKAIEEYHKFFTPEYLEKIRSNTGNAMVAIRFQKI